MQTGGSIDLKLGDEKDEAATVGNGSEVKGWMDATLSPKGALADADTVKNAGDINITLSNDITVTDVNNKMSGNYSFNFTGDKFAGKTITIDGGNHTIKIDNEGLYFLQLENCTVILKNIIIDGGWNGQNGGLSRQGAFIKVTDSSNAQYNSELEIEKGTTIQNCKNIADGDDNMLKGGAICSDGGTITINGGNISNCSAVKSGGAIYSTGGTITINGGNISNCSTAGSGGAIYNDVDGMLTMNDGRIKDCRAYNEKGKKAGYGGAITNNAGLLTINGGNIIGCSASYRGGAINNNANGIMTINRGSITNCTADKYVGAIYNSGYLKLPPQEFGFLTITFPEEYDNSPLEEVMGYEGIYNNKGDDGRIHPTSNYKIVFVDESNPPKQLNTGAVMGSRWDYISVFNLDIDIIDSVRYVNKSGKETSVAVRDGKFQLTRDMTDSAEKGVITFKVGFGAAAYDTVKYVASGCMILDKKSKPTNYSGVNLPISGLQKVPKPKNIIFDFCHHTIHHNDPNVSFIQTEAGQNITICNLKMDGSGCK